MNQPFAAKTITKYQYILVILNFKKYFKIQLKMSQKYKKNNENLMLIFIYRIQRGNGIAYQIINSKVQSYQMPKKGICTFNFEKPICYVIQRKVIYKFPYNKFSFALQNMEISQTETCDYFNYGFSRETMCLYSKIIKMFIEKENTRIEPKKYDPSIWNLLRLNDQLPIDLGGFSPFLNKNDIDISFSQNFEKGDTLLEYLVQMCLMINFENFKLSSVEKKQGITEFIRSMYRKNTLQKNYFADVIDQIEKNIEKRYNQIIKQQKLSSSRIQLINNQEKEIPSQEAINRECNKKVVVSKDQAINVSNGQTFQQDYCCKKRLHYKDKQKVIIKSKKVRKDKSKQKKHKGGIKKMNKRHKNIKKQSKS